MGSDRKLLYAVIVVVVLALLFMAYRDNQKKDNFCPNFCRMGRSPMHLTACNTCDSWDPAALAELKGLDEMSVYGSTAQANKALNMAIQKAQTASWY